MKLEKGSTRTVLVFTYFVIKFPRIIVVTNEEPRIKEFLLFNNLAINFREFVCWAFYRPGLCMPTYFSLFGLFNIQKAGKPTRHSDLKARPLIAVLDKYIYQYFDEENLSQTDRFIIGHDSVSVKNLFWNNKTLRMVDYGSLPMYKFVKKNRKNNLKSST